MATDLWKWSALAGVPMLHGPTRQNYLMVDGHVEGLEFDDTLLNGSWNVTGSLWDATT